MATSNKTNQNDFFYFQKAKIDTKTLETSLGELFAWDFDFKAYSNAINNIFSEILCKADVSIIEKLREDFEVLNSAKSFFIELDENILPAEE